MFRDYIYLDTDRMKRYATKIKVQKIELEQGEEHEAEEMLFEEFEYKLEQEHLDKDFIEISDEKENFIEGIQRQVLIRFESELLIPEEFGQVEFIKKVLSNDTAKNRLSQILSQDDQSIPKEFISSLIKDRGSAPVYFDLGEYKVCSNLQGKYFRNIEYAEFEENVQEEVTVVAKVDSICKVDKDIILYNIYKDLLGLGREMRRSLTNKEKGKNDIPEEIRICGKEIRVSILAIYK